MRKSVLFFASAVLVFLVGLPVTAGAQQASPKAWQPFDGKLLISANVGIQVGDNDLSRTSNFDLYDEQATVTVNQTINNGFFFEIGGAYQYRPTYGFGITWGILSNSGEGNISGQLPHPQFFEQPRSFSADASDLKHTEHSVHFQAIYFMPFTEKVDFQFSGGPSIFRTTQGLIRNVAFSENPPNFNTVTIDSVDVVELSDSGWGFNLGADMTYAVTPSIGVGALLRYTRGNIEFNLSDSQTADVTAGGFQLGAGVRFKF
jgi:opacity protein-like surface antigen